MTHVAATDYHDIVQVEDPRVSPDGTRVAFVRKVPRDGESYEQTVYVVPTDGSEDPRRLTIAEGDDSQPRWSPDGDRLAFVSTRGAEDDRPQLWVLPLGGGEAERITDVPGGVSGIEWLSLIHISEREDGIDVGLDGEEYERETPDPRVVDRLVYRQHERYRDGTVAHIYVADVEGEGGDAASSDRVERLTDGELDHVSPAWRDDETLYLGVKYPQGEVEPDDSVVIDIQSVDLDSDDRDLSDVTRTTCWGLVMDVASDGRVAYGHTPEERLSMRSSDIRVYDPETDETTTPTENLDRTVDLSGFEWGPSEEFVYFLTPDEGHYVSRRVRGDAAEEPELLADEGHATGLSVDGDAGDPVVAYAKSEWDHRGDVFSFRDGEETRLTEVNADYLAGVDVGEPEELWFESDSREVQGWVLTPPEFDDESRDEDETYPLVAEIHGGPHAMWTASGSMWHEYQLLAARGYVVFWSNPRGSTGYGEAFTTAIESDWGDVTMTDVMNGVEAVCERDYVDESNAFVTGGSFGGFMTGWIAGHTDFFAGAVAQRGVFDLSSFYGSTDAFKLIEGDFDSAPWEDPEFLWEQSPVAYADEVTTPTLVMHADNDFRVPVNNGEMFYLFMKKNGVETRLVRYPREGHELSRSGEPAHVVDRLERTVRWFDGYSEHHDAPKALERGDDGLSAAADDENETEGGDENEDDR
ncbi:dipeptidyl aminopeptidase/acylaminoacyl peptidase [Halogeometricum pallidum JCM 14848]|uniref:Dipeptidyl aminopeptidase/acylaminoacyl peptidase n=1 Tax=Halogeometricum pallidum JCM 14848 TaxID=1227487 RepID=M0D6N1_HALPD|nr:S9 family peptidase [Halogeometricum pallidum]ELZ31125.1 dipeptidyl aminopeptidase/acylaminoacyl peptidase [Halogeometricum pallidum JCM 14848]